MMCLYTYTPADAVFLSSWSILLSLLGFCVRKYRLLKDKYDETSEELKDVRNMYDLSAERCIELEKESENRIIRFEQVVSQPLEFSCQCSFNNRVSEDTKSEMVYEELANRLLSEFKKNPDLLSLKTTEDFLEDNQIIEARVRLLPYIRRQTA